MKSISPLVRKYYTTYVYTGQKVYAKYCKIFQYLGYNFEKTFEIESSNINVFSGIRIGDLLIATK